MTIQAKQCQIVLVVAWLLSAQPALGGKQVLDRTRCAVYFGEIARVLEIPAPVARNPLFLTHTHSITSLIQEGRLYSENMLGTVREPIPRTAHDQFDVPRDYYEGLWDQLSAMGVKMVQPQNMFEFFSEVPLFGVDTNGDGQIIVFRKTSISLFEHEKRHARDWADVRNYLMNREGLSRKEAGVAAYLFTHTPEGMYALESRGAAVQFRAMADQPETIPSFYLSEPQSALRAVNHPMGRMLQAYDAYIRFQHSHHQELSPVAQVITDSKNLRNVFSENRQNLVRVRTRLAAILREMSKTHESHGREKDARKLRQMAQDLVNPPKLPEDYDLPDLYPYTQGILMGIESSLERPSPAKARPSP